MKGAVCVPHPGAIGFLCLVFAKRQMGTVRSMWTEKFRLLVMLALALAACSNEPPPARAPGGASPAAKPAAEQVIVAMGDSLTAGYGLDESEAYPALLEARLQADGRPWRVVNAGISGETSSGARSRVDWVVSRLKPDLVILVTGANDGLRGIEPALIEENLRAIVQRLQQSGAVVVLGGMRMVRNLGSGYTAAFEAVYPRVARDLGVPLIPFFLEGVAGDPRLNQADFIHPTAEGYRRIVDHIYPFVREAIKQPHPLIRRP